MRQAADSLDGGRDKQAPNQPLGSRHAQVVGSRTMKAAENQTWDTHEIYMEEDSLRGGRSPPPLLISVIKLSKLGNLLLRKGGYGFGGVTPP